VWIWWLIGDMVAQMVFGDSMEGYDGSFGDKLTHCVLYELTHYCNTSLRLKHELISKFILYLKI
jgi:hypothetical protein